MSEADDLTRSIRQSLAGASSSAREAALAQLVGGLKEAELAELRDRAKELERRRGK